MMNLEQIDQLLADWQHKINLISQNLIDLQAFPTYQRLSGDPGYPLLQLKGVTQARVNPALQSMNELFQHFDLLLNTLNQATDLRKQILRFLGSESKIREIEKILKSPSIKLPAVQIPLAMRHLLSATETVNAIAPEQLLMEMIKAFQIAKDAVLAVDSAWSTLEEKLAQAELEVSTLQKLAKSLGVNIENELLITRQKIDCLRDRIDTDPLGVSADFDQEIRATLAQIKTNLENLVKQQNQIKDNLAIAHNLFNQLTQIHHQAEIAFQESYEKILEQSHLQSPLPIAQIDALGQWLSRLETKFSEGILNPVSVGLANWMIKAQEYITIENKAYTANNAPLATRKELRGRLEALKVKAVARGLAEDPTIAELAENAKQLLYTSPTPLDQALDLVSRYEKKIK